MGTDLECVDPEADADGVIGIDRVDGLTVEE
jgi:hypothetical protein